MFDPQLSDLVKARRAADLAQAAFEDKVYPSRIRSSSSPQLRQADPI